ncbi:YeaC family protein [Acinetobacter boissieri]|uniref:DUF1315 family protein n=1 Tax=Acinetobacter boissieri TaxID=1219383 RepID=A0A1G6IHB0_9GAMM|nr:DUF1315 family protein [Acinetobacter boissieri]SDC05790.1 hypothetical protein SAMN05421733_108124 [Acinetobacter boissieri]
MNLSAMLDVLDEHIVERLKTAVEIGKWPNGIALTAEQKQICMHAVMAWEHTHLPAQQRTGYIEKPKSADHSHTNDDSPIRFV